MHIYSCRCKCLWGRISIYSRHNLSQGSSRRQPTMVMDLRLWCIKPLSVRFQASCCSKWKISSETIAYSYSLLWTSSAGTVDKRLNTTQSAITVCHCSFSCKTKNAEGVLFPNCQQSSNCALSSNKHVIYSWENIHTGPRLCCLNDRFHKNK